MSSKNYRLIHNQPKQNAQFRDDPLTINDQYQVYLSEDTNRVYDLIEKDRKKPRYSLRQKLDTQSPIKKQTTFTLPADAKPIETAAGELPHIEPKEIQQMSKTMGSGQITLKKFKESLQFDERTKSIPKSMIQNHIIDSIIQNSDVILKKSDLVAQLQQLKRLQLLKNYNLNHNILPGVGKSPYVMNDFHSKSTNNGYSRNDKNGNFFTR